MRKYVFILLIVNTSLLIAQQPTLEWAARYTGAPPGYVQVITDAVTDSGGSTYITGYIWIVNQPNTKDCITLKINSLGIIEWVKMYNGGNNEDDKGLAITVDNYGFVYVAGWSDSATTSIDFLTVKYDKSGNVVWIKKYDNSNSLDEANDIAVNDSGNVYVTGVAYLMPGPNPDYCTIKYDSSGNQQWVRFYGGLANLSDYANNIAIDKIGDVIVTGNITRVNSINDIVTLKYNPAGTLIWTKTYTGVNNSGAGVYSKSILIDGFNYFYFTCSTAGGNFLILKYNSSGDTVWVKNTRNDILSRTWICTDTFSNIYAVGSWPDTSNRLDVTIVKYNNISQLIWKRKYPNTLYQSSDVAQNVAVDRYGNVYTTGYNDSMWLFNDFLTVKYDSTGLLKWAMRYSFALFSDDKAFYINLDSKNNIYVTGITAGSGIEFGGNITTIKYSQPVGIKQIGFEIPDEYKLYQNYPNPFNPYTNIKYQLVNNGSNVVLDIFDVTCRLIITLVNQKQNAGTYEIDFEGTDLSSGVYFYRLSAGDFVQSKKMVLVK